MNNDDLRLSWWEWLRVLPVWIWVEIRAWIRRRTG